MKVVVLLLCAGIKTMTLINYACYCKYSLVIFATVASILTYTQGHVLEFTVEPTDTVVESGQSAVLDCVIKSSHPASVLIQWLDQDRQKLTYLGDLYRSQLTNGSLYINSVLEEQRLTGTYQCMASLPNVGSIVSKAATLNVASISGFLEEPRDLRVYEGQRAHFACHVVAAPPAKIRWLKDERPLQIDELRMTLLPSGALEIDEVAESDQGAYRCNATGLNLYKLSNKATLTVSGDREEAHFVPPTFIARPKSAVVVEGQNVSLDCAANGYPHPSITWLKDGSTIDMTFLDSRFSKVGSTSSLRITNIKEEDAGTYQCRAANREDSLDASATIQVQVPPRFRKKPQDKIENANKDIELECSVYGNPEPKISWFKDGEAIISNDYYQIVNGHNLKIMGLMPSDSGIFQCFASNPAGNIQAAASLKVLNPAESSVAKTTEGFPGPPQDLKAPIVKARFVTLSWRAPLVNSDNIHTYTVYYRQEGSERWRVQNTSRSRLEEINIAGLTPSKVYHFRVVAINSVGAGVSSESLTVTTQSEEHVASAPTHFVAYATSPRTIYLNWRPPETPNGNILRYMVYYMETSSSVEHNIDTTELKYHLVGLSVYTEYSVWVVAVNENGPGAATDEKIVRTLSASPSEPPSNITLEPTSTTVIVRWEPPPPEYQNGVITGYKLKYRKQGKKGVTVTTSANERFYVLNDLERGAEYQVKLWAINVNGTSPPTEWITVETYKNDLDESRVPDLPGPLRVRPTSNKLYVLWTPPSNQNIRVRNYILGWGKGIPDMYTQELDEKTRSYLIDKLEANSEYVLSLRAANQMGPGPPVYTTVRTQDEPPPEPSPPLIPPVGLKAQILSATSVVLYWTDTTLSKSQFVRDNRYYVVKYTAERTMRTRTVNVSDLNVMIDDLKPNTLYEFAVKLVKGRKESPWSMVVQNATWELAPNASPRDLDVHLKEDEPQLVELTWQPPKITSGRITGYVILYTDNKTKSDREWLAQATKGDKHSAVLGDLKPNTEYYFKVQARNSKGYGPFSNVVIFTTGSNVGTLVSSSRQHLDGKGIFSGTVIIYFLIGGCIIAVTTIGVVTTVLCCRRRDAAASPDRSKKGYQKGNQSVKPPDLWIHHDQMELKAMEKSQSNHDGASSSGAMTLPRSVGGNDYDPHESGIHTNSLDQRTYVPNYMGVSPDDKIKRPIRSKPIITLPVVSTPPREPIATPINTTSLSQSSTDSTPSSRPSYPRTQYNMARAHVTVDPLANPENPYALHPSSWTEPNISQVPPMGAHVPATYAPGLGVLAESQGCKRVPAQSHPLKSFTVPAPPPISAPGTPQPKHIVRPNSSPYKKPPTSSSSTLAGTPPSRINPTNPPPHTAEEVQRLQPSHSTEELNQEMANLEGLMLTLSTITANQFEC
ncbi:neogenin isoform X4 [Tribolium castaneum]|uniref:neogenin isoform X4 n=1 Tax=Tribolium castaneum TaxID=7070 RepID=UPI00077DC8B7|nr:PREDICTED: neogenin isoform X4 [Tribolium castaneum]|eukprot:XP_015837098.1 PREDICTED: neogenin isoform X4 [Tribolium castaneum]